ncbi:hypothetical protein R3P38DRAFT_2554208 [Favolaschia claudopus]|uniref:Uncharacterized protein n=1 Tax=Favolaschia claudopus TaxID=2862362 RepID=A0AAW0ADH2_9AGAR
MCGGTCLPSIKAKKLNSQCPSTYPFMISTAKKFLSTRPCTNVPIACVMVGCNETHWKYNYKQHLAERHPDWQRLIPVTFLPELQISREELLELKIPSHLGCLAPTAKAFYSVDSSHSLYAEKTVGNITG